MAQFNQVFGSHQRYPIWVSLCSFSSIIVLEGGRHLRNESAGGNSQCQLVIFSLCAIPILFQALNKQTNKIFYNKLISCWVFPPPKFNYICKYYKNILNLKYLMSQIFHKRDSELDFGYLCYLLMLGVFPPKKLVSTTKEGFVSPQK